MINNFYYYQITDINGTSDFIPLGEYDFSIDFEKNNEDYKNFYSKTFNGKLTIIKDAFLNILALDNSENRCDRVRIDIFKKCSKSNLLVFSSYVSLNDITYDLDRCLSEIKFQEEAPDQCIQDTKSLKVNLFDLIPEEKRVTVKTSCLSSQLEITTCVKTARTYVCIFGNCPPINPSKTEYCDPVNPFYEGSLYKLFYTENYLKISIGGSGSSYYVYENKETKKYAREIAIISCDDNIPEGWTLLENCENNNKKIGRPATTLSCRFTDSKDGYAQYNLMECDLLGSENNVNIDNGLRLNDVLERLFEDCLNGKKIISDFFQLNPRVLSNRNYVTNKESRTNNLILFQKSDVKRPSAVNNATIAEITKESLLEALSTMFNVKYDFDTEGNLIIEHVSYFNRSQDIDVTDPALKKWFTGKNKYSYDSDNLPNSEIFKFQEQTDQGDWMGEIKYTQCLRNVRKTTDKTYNVDNITTDVQLCLNNPDPKSNVVEDSGFCLISAYPINSVDYCINIEQGIKEQARLNNPLSWSHLIRDYLSYDRPQINAIVNGEITVFNTAKWIKKGEKFSIPYCLCSANFNPQNLIKTPLGLGMINKATYNLKNDMLELELYYNHIAPLNIEKTFTIKSGEVLTVNNFSSDNILKNIFNSENNGTVEFFTNSNFIYYPPLDFKGEDFFNLKNNYFNQKIKIIII